MLRREREREIDVVEVKERGNAVITCERINFRL